MCESALCLKQYMPLQILKIHFYIAFAFFFFPLLFNLVSAVTSHNDHITHFKTIARLWRWWCDSSDSKTNRKRSVGGWWV